MDDRFLEQSAAAQGRAIAAGQVDPRDLAEAYLDRIARHAHGPRIYARATPERARAEAAAAHARARDGRPAGPLDGVPVSWKDLFDTAGTATEAGSALLEGRVPEADAPVVTRGAAAGLVCLGKTHMSELAFSGLGLNPVTATPPCVNDLEAVSGGSSSGAAASVAFGLAAAAVGSDTGGSVRVPAAWNDLVGLKTTSGLLPLEGVVPLVPSFDTVGPLARSVEDAGLLLAALAGQPAQPPRAEGLAGRRFLVLETIVLDDLHPLVAEAFERALARLSSQGATLVRAGAPEVAEAMALAAQVFTPEAYALWRETIEAAPEKMFPRILERFRSGAEVAAVDFIAAWERLRALRADWAARVADFDAVLLPSVPVMPPRVAALDDEATYVRENLMVLRNTRVANMLGLCALTLPTDTKSVGLMAMGPACGEAALLNIGAALEPVVAG